MSEELNVTVIESDVLIAHGQTKYHGFVELPEDTITIGKSSEHELVALFKHEFSSVSKATVYIDFQDDLFEQGDIWIIDTFRGQRNDGERPISRTEQHQDKCSILQQFIRGRFNFTIRSKSGSMKVSKISFDVLGVKR